MLKITNEQLLNNNLVQKFDQLTEGYNVVEVDGLSMESIETILYNTKFVRGGGRLIFKNRSLTMKQGVIYADVL